ncbi:hypothetical protein Y032_0031g2248 [Ancylostoma ceylanicum]|uniref:Uncharacterized protein n=1 Tax=Ancylostoma ceylanicum TaxID=53326 RepID=A0A016UPJ0_9BILA|nr:hypothetical protein Y032_0031g2248 [Ancylostoma ceylanicum]
MTKLSPEWKKMLWQKYDCELEAVAYQLARDGLSSMPERNALYGESPRKGRLNVKNVIQGWKHRLQLMSNEKKFGCIVLAGRKLFKAFYLISIACFADASKHKLPDCQMMLPLETIGKHMRGRLYDEVEYDCELEEIAHQLARDGLSSMPERNALYGESTTTERLNLRNVVQGWKHRLQLMSNETKFGCIVLAGPRRFKVVCVFE